MTTQTPSKQASDRTWPLPKRPWAMRMSWHDLLFAHWRVEVEQIRTLIPEPLSIDTFDGSAWIGVVPFRMSDVAPRFVPAINALSAFPELNVRTYVTVDGKPGVWFFSLDATNKLAVRVARSLFHLRYMDAKISIERSEVRHGTYSFDYTSHRTHRNEPKADLRIKYSPTGERFFAKPDSLEYFLTARYCLYAANKHGVVYRGEIDHPPWPLQTATTEIEENSMISWLGIPQPKDDPHLLFVDRIDVRAWLNERVQG